MADMRLYIYDTPIRGWQLCLCMLEWGWVRRAGVAVTPRSPLSDSVALPSSTIFSGPHCHLNTMPG